MPRLKVAPTKSNLLKLKQNLELAREGHDLLNEKREVLLMELMGIVHDLKRVREEGEQKLKEAYSALEAALVTMGKEDLRRITFALRRKIDLDILDRSIMGVAIPTIQLNFTPESPEIFLTETNSAFDQAYNKFKELIAILARWARIEISVFRLATELRKMQRRVKALENIFIPDYEAAVEEIEKVLEEAEREEFFRKKRVKRKLQRAREAQNYV